MIVAPSKTKAGAGRVVPLTRRACAALTPWHARFSGAEPDSHVFPIHHVSFAKVGDKPRLWAVDLNGSMGIYSYKPAYKTACSKAGLDFRFYDARHTFVTRLAENPTISEETIRQLAGHVSYRMLARYVHIRAEARRNAIATLERADSWSSSDFATESPQNPPQSGKIDDRSLN